MKKLFQFGLLFAAFCALFGRADAADDTETRSIPIDARVVRVKLDGVIDLKLRQGDVASLRLIGEKRYLDKLTASQSGDTLHLESEGRGVKIGRGTTRAERVSQFTNDRRLDSRGRRTHELTQLLELGHDDLALDTELLRDLRDVCILSLVADHRTCRTHFQIRDLRQPVDQ